jgi:hypothetical protein
MDRIDGREYLAAVLSEKGLRDLTFSVSLSLCGEGLFRSFP